MRWNGSDWEDIPANLGGEDTEYADTDVELGKEYWYAIRAMTASGMGEWTQTGFQSATLAAEAPDAPVVMPSVDGQDITLSWTPPANNGSSIVRYTIQTTTEAPENDEGPVEDTDRSWLNATPANPTPAAATTHTYRDVNPGETRYYRVRAENSATTAEGEWSEEVEARANPNPPAMPGSLTGSSDQDRQVNLTWDLADPGSAGTGGAAITSVEVQRWNSATGRWVTIETVTVSLNEAEDGYTTGQGYMDMDLEAGTTYSYRVRAVNEAGSGGWATIASGTTTTAAPKAPDVSISVDGQDITISWDPPDNNGLAIVRYEIQRLPSVDATGASQNTWGDNVATGVEYMTPAPPGRTTYTDTDLDPGVTYYYRVRAVNTASPAEGAYSATVSETTAAKVPGRIEDDAETTEVDEGLTLSAGTDRVTLSWTAPAPNGSNISRYEIIRWNPDTSMWDVVRDDLPASVLQYVETGLESETLYFYRIRAVNGVGAGPWSTFERVTTLEDE
jgi:titin